VEARIYVVGHAAILCLPGMGEVRKASVSSGQVVLRRLLGQFFLLRWLCFSPVVSPGTSTVAASPRNRCTHGEADVPIRHYRIKFN
jgi:hypothetical protein